MRPASVAAIGILVVGLAALAYWAGTTAVAPPSLGTVSSAPERYAAATGVVGKAIDTRVSASWPTARVLRAADDGVMTQVRLDAGGEARAGDVIATIDLEPVVVAQGEVPMFRSLEEGARGADVAQVQRLLLDLGLYDGPTDGDFGSTTRAAVLRWQAGLGVTADGVVPSGMLVFAPDLPARLEILPSVGERVDPGSDLVRVLARTPSFVARFGASQLDALRSGMDVSIDAPDGSMWPGSLTTFEPSDDGGYTSILGGPLCGQDCAQIGSAGETELTGQVTIVEDTTGVVVPLSALVQQPDGTLAVTLGSGDAHQVRVIAQADGFAVVDGLSPGTEILLPGAPAS